MKVRILGSSGDNTARRQYASSYLINGTVAIDAGCLGFHGSPQEQEHIRHVFLTHSHSDHTATLPIFLENVWTPTGECPWIYGLPETLEDMQRYIFNKVMWPDFIALSRKMRPFMRLCPLEPEVPVSAGGLSIKAVPVNHQIPTVGYVISDGQTAIIVAGDTAPTTRLWEAAHQTAGLQAIFLEACFPNSLKGLAEASYHLTPEMFGREVAKMPPAVRVIATHVKVRYRDEIVRELSALKHPQVEIGECEKEYAFSDALVGR